MECEFVMPFRTPELRTCRNRSWIESTVGYDSDVRQNLKSAGGHSAVSIIGDQRNVENELHFKIKTGVITRTASLIGRTLFVTGVEG